MLSILEKEQKIIGTILHCNEEIRKLQEIKILNESLFNPNLYHYNMRNCLNSINPLFESEQNIPNSINAIENKFGNYYSYFKNVFNFLDGYEPNLIQTLNESLTVDANKVSNPIQININTFKNDLKAVITELSKKDDLENLPKDILKIKIFARKPIMIYGFDIINNISLRKELFEKYNITNNDIISILFDKSNKRILFVTRTINTLLCYDLRKDILDFYLNIVDESEITKVKETNLTIKNYNKILKEYIHNNLIELYLNTDILDFKFSDNLYGDTKLAKMLNTNNPSQQQQQTSIVKK